MKKILSALLVTLLSASPIGIVLFLADNGEISHWWVLGVIAMYVFYTITFVCILKRSCRK
jgi:hypothetical protein